MLSSVVLKAAERRRFALTSALVVLLLFATRLIYISILQFKLRIIGTLAITNGFLSTQCSSYCYYYSAISVAPRLHNAEEALCRQWYTC